MGPHEMWSQCSMESWSSQESQCFFINMEDVSNFYSLAPESQCRLKRAEVVI